MTSRYKRSGWFGESHRHYLASKGIRTTYPASKREEALKKLQQSMQQRQSMRTYEEPQGNSVGYTRSDEELGVDLTITDEPTRSQMRRQEAGLDPDYYVITLRDGGGKMRTITIPDDQYAAVRDFAQRTGTSMKEAFSQYAAEVQEGMQARGEELSAAGDWVVEHIEPAKRSAIQAATATGKGLAAGARETGRAAASAYRVTAPGVKAAAGYGAFAVTHPKMAGQDILVEAREKGLEVAPASVRKRVEERQKQAATARERRIQSRLAKLNREMRNPL